MSRIILFVCFTTTIMYSQNFGVSIGLTTATLTGNNDAYNFDFIDSFSPGYKLGFLGNFELSDVITLKPELSYRLYAMKQDVEHELNLYNFEQVHQSAAIDINFDIKLPNSWSLIFGMGIDYLFFKKNTIVFNDIENVYSQNISGSIDDQSLDPFANIGLCYTVSRNFLIDLEYRHLLDNWGVGNLNDFNELISSANQSVKLHMINLSLAFVF